MFSILNSSMGDRKRRRAAFISGLLSEALLIGVAIFLGVLFPNELPPTNQHYSLTWLPALPPPEKPVLKPPLEVARVVVPKLKPPETSEIAAPSVADLEVPRIRHTTPFTPAPESPIPAPPVAPPTPSLMERMAVHTGHFDGAPAPVTTKRPVEEVQVGGFGNPQGLLGWAQGENPGNIPKLGAFALPEGPGSGNGAGGPRGVQGVVANAGFSSGVVGMGSGREGGGTGGAGVTLGGFERAGRVSQPREESVNVPLPTEFQPIEILSKPSPVYTEEARRLGTQGEVVLFVVFQASGAIRVIGVAKSLGHGLDQAAEQAAAQIRFKPAQRDGQPADFPATLRIQFRLADQST